MAVGEIGAAAGLTPRDSLNALAKMRSSVENPLMAERLNTRLRATGRADLADQLIARDRRGQFHLRDRSPVALMSSLVSGMGGDANAVSNLLSAGGRNAAMVLDSQQRRLISAMASQTSGGQTIAQRVATMTATTAGVATLLAAVLPHTALQAQTAPKRTDPGPPPASVMWVGNSFFYYNNSMHSHVLGLVRADDPKSTARAVSVTISGSGIDWHDVASYLGPDRIGKYSFVGDNEIRFNPPGRQFDAVFFNNTVGNCFTDPGLRQSLVEFVYGGGGLMGVHGTSVAFTQWPGAKEDWPEFGLMIGARGANHRANDEHVFIKLDDPAHPVNQPFGGQGFDYRDEFFRVHEPYSRNRVRVLMSIDTQKTDLQQGSARGKLERADNDYALAWLRNYGRGRTFYCTIAHNPYVFRDPKLLRFYLGAAQFILGDLPAPTVPRIQKK